ncbi:methyltransferase domain-containing protein [Pseudodesulfovibrio thermohalotolerans]|uniref:class I SAM-dependent methyltransferase n=1 Tax=Pseudodesulfovibrio thermohalotolerans TaxID=2880651 RepID=UPI00244321F2|nr:methyltransferase domain-containing protein [Pseudodesulfovibrio thermohalotolerans]WFS63479.1 methyltransferase domain-containing protein [Pseudodesulfovibrio thermohalotolerans]
MSNTKIPQENEAPRKGYGPTSFWLQEPAAVFAHLDLKPGQVFLDAGCGAGEYSLYAAPLLGETGAIIAVDNIRISTDALNKLPARPGEAPITAFAADITAPLPIEPHSVDVIFLSTVLHIKKVRDRAAEMFREFHRLLRPGSTLAVLECKKVEANFGPPLHSRLSEEDVRALVEPHGFSHASTLDTGHANLIRFEAE